MPIRLFDYVIVLQSSTAENVTNKSRLSKKHVLIAVITIFVTGLVVTGALVGMKIYTDSSLEIIKVIKFCGAASLPLKFVGRSLQQF